MKKQNKPTPIRKIGLCLKPASSRAGEFLVELVDWLSDNAVEVLFDKRAGEVIGVPGLDRKELGEKSDFLVVLGGDGTLLAVAREIGERPVPIVGINLGRLGFLAEIAPGERFEALARFLEGDYEVTQRMRLEVEASRGGQKTSTFLALNDAVIARSDPSRMIDVELRVDGDLVTTYPADGVVVATPTGSTAYSLSAGGPILLPSTGAFVLTPISAHTLSQRPLVLPGKARVELTVFPREGEAQLTVDGQSHVSLQPGDSVKVTGSHHPVSFVTSPFLSHFDLLRTKLNWGAD